MNDLEKVLAHYHIPITSTKQKILCPFHGDINASLLVDVDDGKWFCFGCQMGGDAFRFHKEYQNQLKNYNDIDILMKYNKIKQGSNQSKDVLTQVIEEKKDKFYYRQKMLEAKDFYYGLKKVNWEKDETEVSYYMEYRGFKRKTLTQAKAKYTYQDNYPIIFPILDSGRFKGWVCRTIDTEIEKKRKYLYNTGFRRRYVLAGDYDSKVVMLVEGYMDKMKANQLGVKNVAALLGWKITKFQIEKLKESGVKVIISALDNDKCGKLGTKELKEHFDVITFPYPEGVKDMGDMTQEQFNKAKKIVKRKLQKMEEQKNV